MGKKNNQLENTNGVSLVTLVDSSSPVAEQYRTIRTNIQYSSVGQKVQTLVVTSSVSNEGKSTTSANLAIVFAKAGQKVLLVDADMRKPTLFKTFNLINSIGLSTLLSSPTSILEATQETAVENLSVLTSGPKPPNPSELLGSGRMEQIIAEAQTMYDIIIFDMPPIVAVTDAQIMASKVDGTILVVRETVAKKETLFKAKKLLELVRARVLGVVYNGAKQTKDQGYYYYGR
ncbi:MAG: CpsD/CapB family tyrosine-protein kinase [Enterococcus sp.]